MKQEATSVKLIEFIKYTKRQREATKLIRQGLKDQRLACKCFTVCLSSQMLQAAVLIAIADFFLSILLWLGN